MQQIRFRATRPMLRSPIRSGSAGLAVAAAVVAQRTLQVLAPVAAHSPACFPSAGAAVAAVTWGIVQVCSDSTRLRHLKEQVEQEQGDLCWHAHWQHCRPMTVAVAGNCCSRLLGGGGWLLRIRIG